MMQATQSRRRLGPLSPTVAEVVRQTLELPPPDETLLVRREPRTETLRLFARILRRVRA